MLNRLTRDFERIDDIVDNDDSGVSLVSSTSSKIREDEQERVLNGGTHSLIRRQSVIIEGLTLENEVSSYGGGAVEDLRQKLEQVDGKLEATESYCYQMVEENVEKRDEEREKITPLLAATLLAQPSWTN